MLHLLVHVANIGACHACQPMHMPVKQAHDHACRSLNPGMVRTPEQQDCLMHHSLISAPAAQDLAQTITAKGDAPEEWFPSCVGP